MILEQLAYKISIQARGFTEGKRKVTEDANELKNSIDRSNKQTGESFNRLTQGVKEFGESGQNAFSRVQVGAAKFLGVALTLEGARRLFTSTTQTLVQLGNTSQFLGVSAQSVDGWGKAFEAAGGSAANAVGMMAKLRQQNVNYQSGMAAPDQNLRMLEQESGMSIIEESDPTKQMRNYAEALRKLPRNRSMQYFNLTGDGDMATYNTLTSGDLDSAVANFTSRSGATDANIKKAQEVNRVMKELNATMEGLGQNLTMAFGDELISSLNELDHWVTNNKDKIIAFFKDGAQWANDFAAALNGSGNAIHSFFQISDNFNLLSGFQKPVIDVPGISKAAGDVTIPKNDVLAANPGDPFGVLPKPQLPYGGNDYKPQGETNLIDTVKGWINGEPEQHGQSSRRRATKGDLMDAIMMTESGGINGLTSRAGAAGLYQFMPKTARGYGLVVNDQIDERLDPVKSRAASTRMMAYLLKKYGGNTTNALRAYNWGEGNMDAYLKAGAGVNGQQMPKETVDYPFKVAQHYSGMGMMSISRPNGAGSTYDQSQSNSTYIQNVNVNGTPTTVEQITNDAQAQVDRSRIGVTFSNGNR